MPENFKDKAKKMKPKSIPPRPITLESMTPKSITPRPITRESMTPKSVPPRPVTLESMTPKSVTSRPLSSAAPKVGKLRAEALAQPKVKPELPAPGKGPRIDIPPAGPKIEVPKDLQKEILETKTGRKPASKIRGVPRSELAQAYQLRLPERVPIRLPESGSMGPKIERPKFTVSEPVKVAPKGTITRAQVESLGVKERIGKGVKPPPAFRPDPPRVMQLGPGKIKPKPIALPAKTRPRVELSTVDRVKEYKEKLAARSGSAPAPQGVSKPVGAQEYLDRVESLKTAAPKQPRMKLGVGRGVAAAYAAAKAPKGQRAAAAAARLRAPTMLESAAQGTGKLAKLARGARVAGKVLGPVGVALDVVTIGEAAKEGYGMRQAMQHQKTHAGALKKRGYTVTRPELTVSDVVNMANPFTPENWRMLLGKGEGFTPAAAEVKNLKIYAPDGKEVTPTVRQRKKKTIKPGGM